MTANEQDKTHPDGIARSGHAPRDARQRRQRGLQLGCGRTGYHARLCHHVGVVCPLPVLRHCRHHGTHRGLGAVGKILQHLHSIWQTTSLREEGNALILFYCRSSTCVCSKALCHREIACIWNNGTTQLYMNEYVLNRESRARVCTHIRAYKEISYLLFTESPKRPANRGYSREQGSERSANRTGWQREADHRYARARD